MVLQWLKQQILFAMGPYQLRTDHQNFWGKGLQWVNEDPECDTGQHVMVISYLVR